MNSLDKMFLLMEIRKKTKGEVLEFKINCPECKSQSINRVNLDALELTKLDSDENHIVTFGEIKVHLRHIKRKHQIADMKPQFFPKSLTDTQKAYVYQTMFYACAIDKIETPSGLDSNIDIKDRLYFVENIPLGGIDKIREEVDGMAFGWKLEQRITCPHCQYEQVEEIPIQQNFFG